VARSRAGGLWPRIRIFNQAEPKALTGGIEQFGFIRHSAASHGVDQSALPNRLRVGRVSPLFIYRRKADHIGLPEGLHRLPIKQLGNRLLAQTIVPVWLLETALFDALFDDRARWPGPGTPHVARPLHPTRAPRRGDPKAAIPAVVPGAGQRPNPASAQPRRHVDRC